MSQVEQRPSWGEAVVEGSLDWSFLTRGDLPEVAELCAAIEYIDDPAQHRSLDQMQREFDRPLAHSGNHAVVGRDRGGTIVAYAWNHITPSDETNPHVWMEIGVHPAWRHHKIGLRLVGWSIDRARTWYGHIRERRPDIGRLWLGCATDEDSRVSADLVMDGRLAPQRWFFDAHRSLDGELPLVVPPPGIELRVFERQHSEAVRIAHNAAFATRDGAHPVTAADWEASLSRPDSRPDWSWLALRTADPAAGVVGYAVNSEIRDPQTGWTEGWTERFGVLPPYRSQGVGKALLAASMRTFADRGCTLAGIGVDTDRPDAAENLFEGMGYVLDDRMVLYGGVFDQ